MRSRIESAKGVLLYCKDRRSECPGWWTAMQTVALAEGWDWKTYSGLLDEAMKQEPTYQSFYDNAAYFLLPRWHGEPGAWENFAATVADKIGGDDGDIVYDRII